MSKLQEALNRKYLLLDTNIFIHLSNSKDFPLLKSFFDELARANCALLTIDQVYWEFLKYAKSEKEYNDYYQLLEGTAQTMTPSKEDWLESIQLYRALASKDENIANRISPTDLLLGKMLQKWPEEIFLASTDLNDFPVFLYDRETVYAIDNGINTHIIGIFKFNNKKYQSLIKV